MTRAAALVAMALIACRGEAVTVAPAPAVPIAKPRDPGEPLPGQRWITPAQPWRFVHSAVVIAQALDGKTLLAGGERGRFTLYDLAGGGRAIATVKLATPLPVKAIVALDAGRWLAVLQAEPWAVKPRVGTMVIVHATGATLTTSPAPLKWHLDPDRGNYLPPSLVRLPDGTIVISGMDLPLASYDPKTLARRRVFDATTGWTALNVAGHFLLADQLDTVRFDLDAHARLDVPRHRDPDHAVLSDGHTIAFSKTPAGIADVWIEDADGNASAEVGVPGPFDSVGVDPAKPRIVVAHAGFLEVRGATGAIVRELPLGNPLVAPPALETAAWSGDRIAFVHGGTLRVADLAAGTITPIGTDIYDASISVTDEGTIVGHADQTAWEVANGAPIHSRTFARGAEIELETGAGSERNLLVREGKRVGLYDVAREEPIAAWDFSNLGLPHEAFATHDGAHLDYESGAVGYRDIELLRSNGADLATGDVVSRRSAQSLFIDYSADDRTGLVEWNGNVGVIRAGVATPFHLVYPGCADEGVGRLDDTMERAVTWAGNSAAVWNLATGGGLGHAKFAAEVGYVVVDQRPKSHAVWVGTADQLLFWSPGGVTRALATNDIEYLSVSLDGALLGISYRDGRVALVDAAALAAAMPIVPAPQAPDLPERCGEQDPLHEPETANGHDYEDD